MIYGIVSLIYLTLFLCSCSPITVYKITHCEKSDLNCEFHSDRIFLKERAIRENDYVAKSIKEKIEIHLKSKGYDISLTTEKLPRFYMFFNWKTEKKLKETFIPVYEAGQTVYNSGNIHGYDGTSYSYHGSTTTPGTVNIIPYN